jgi:hypothetical protein
MVADPLKIRTEYALLETYLLAGWRLTAAGLAKHGATAGAVAANGTWAPPGPDEGTPPPPTALVTIPFDATDGTPSTTYAYMGGTIVASSGATTNCSIINNSLRFGGTVRVRFTLSPASAEQVVFFDYRRDAGIAGVGAVGVSLRTSSTVNTTGYNFYVAANGTMSINAGTTGLASVTSAIPALASPSVGRAYAKATTLQNGDVLVSLGTATDNTQNEEKVVFTVANGSAQNFKDTGFIGFVSANNPVGLAIDNVSYVAAI